MIGAKTCFGGVNLGGRVQLFRGVRFLASLPTCLTILSSRIRSRPTSEYVSYPEWLRVGPVDATATALTIRVNGLVLTPSRGIRGEDKRTLNANFAQASSYRRGFFIARK